MSPEGAQVSSQGREPLVREGPNQIMSPGGAAERLYRRRHNQAPFQVQTLPGTHSNPHLLIHPGEPKPAGDPKRRDVVGIRIVDGHLALLEYPLCCG